MKLYSIDKDYLDYIYENVDEQVLFSHTGEGGKGRANVWVKRMEYKGQYQDFAIPEKGDISINEHTENSVLLRSVKQGGKFSNGFAINKLMPIEGALLNQFNIEQSPNFRKIATEITRKEPELIAKTKAHLKKLEEGKPGKFSTNVDKQLQFLNARAELLNQGYSEEEIYGESFAMNVKKAEVLKKTDLGAERIKSKEMELKL